MSRKIPHSVSQSGEVKRASRLMPIIMLPPVAFIPIVLLGVALRGTNKAGYFLIYLATTQFIIYIVFTIGALMLQNRPAPRAAQAASLIANGILIVTVTAYLHAHLAYGWTGLLFLLIGIIMLASNIASPSAQAYEIPGVFAADSAVDIPSVKRMLSAVVFPAALLERDAKGEARIVAVNESMASMADSTPDTMKGKLLNAMLPQLQNDAGLISSGVKWIPHRSLMGGKILFMLSPSVKISRASSGAGGSGLFDPNTGVYTRSSMRHLGGVLIKACLRYKKTLSLLLLKLDFEKKSTVSPSDDKKQNAWRAFGKIVLLSIRADDMAFCVDEYEIAIFLPEYSSLDIKYLIEDIHDKINKIAVVECPEIGLSVVYDSSFCGNIDSVDSCDLIIEGLRDGINRNKAA